MLTGMPGTCPQIAFAATEPVPPGAHVAETKVQPIWSFIESEEGRQLEKDFFQEFKELWFGLNRDLGKVMA